MTKRQRDARAGWHAARVAANPRPPMAMSKSVIGTPLPEIKACACCGTSVCSTVPRGWAVSEPGDADVSGKNMRVVVVSMLTEGTYYKSRGYDSTVLPPPEAERCQCGCWVRAEEAGPKCQEPVPTPMQEQQKHDVLKWTFDGFCHRCQIDDSTKLSVSQNRVTIVAGGKRDAWPRHGVGLEGDDDAKAFIERKWREWREWRERGAR